jgi:hypothetical protein
VLLTAASVFRPANGGGPFQEMRNSRNGRVLESMGRSVQQAAGRRPPILSNTESQTGFTTDGLVNATDPTPAPTDATSQSEALARVFCPL